MVRGSPIITFDKAVKTRKGIKIAVHVVAVVRYLPLRLIEKILLFFRHSVGSLFRSVRSRNGCHHARPWLVRSFGARTALYEVH